MTLQNIEIAKIFYEIADLLEIKGANPFRVRAYRNAARTVENYPNRLADMVESDQDITELTGIGDDLAKKIHEMVETGKLTFLEELRQEVPPSLTRLLDVSGLGPKRVQQLYQELGVNSLASLQAALESGQVAELDGFGEKTVENLLDAMDSEALTQSRTRLDVAEQFVQPLLDYLLQNAPVSQVAIAGSYRRKQATVGDLDVIAVSDQGKTVTDVFADYEEVREVVSQGKTKSTILLNSGLQVDLRVVKADAYGAALLYFTGSKAHNIHLREMAVDEGLKMNEYGLFEGETRLAGQTEETIYDYFDLPYIVPELRQDNGEIEAAQRGELPDLVTLEDLRGDLQMHTTASDGQDSIGDMAEKAKQKGYDYIAITDHTAHIRVTDGLKADDLDDYINKIKAYDQSDDDIHVLAGLEVDILKDGSLDMPDDQLAKLDIVVVAIHSHFDLAEKEQTRRLLTAFENPYVNILAHPTTRRIGARDPIAIDLEKVMASAVSQGCFLEINASPQRLDLRDHQIRLAKERGLKLAISTDAHRSAHLDHIKYGVYQARRGWMGAAEIINTASFSGLRELLDRS